MNYSYVISNILSVASILAATEQSIFKTSVACKTYFHPDKTSNEDFAGISTSLIIKTVSFVSMSDVSETNWTSAVTAVVWTLQRVSPMTIVWVDDGQVYSVKGVPDDDGIAAFVFTLNVLANVSPLS